MNFLAKKTPITEVASMMGACIVMTALIEFTLSPSAHHHETEW